MCSYGCSVVVVFVCVVANSLSYAFVNIQSIV